MKDALALVHGESPATDVNRVFSHRKEQNHGGTWEQENETKKLNNKLELLL